MPGQEFPAGHDWTAPFRRPTLTRSASEGRSCSHFIPRLRFRLVCRLFVGSDVGQPIVLLYLATSAPFVRSKLNEK